MLQDSRKGKAPVENSDARKIVRVTLASKGLIGYTKNKEGPIPKWKPPKRLVVLTDVAYPVGGRGRLFYFR